MVKIGEPWDFQGNNNIFDYYYLCHIQFSSNSNAMKKKKTKEKQVVSQDKLHIYNLITTLQCK